MSGTLVSNRADRRAARRRRGGLIGRFLPVNKTPVAYTSRSATAWSSGWMSGTDRGAQLETTETSGTLYGLIRRLYEATAQVDWDLWREAPSGDVDDRVKVAVHAALMLWNKPNPFMTNRLFTEIFQQWVDLVGEAYWVVVRAMGIPLELWPIRPDRMEPRTDAFNFRLGWQYTGPDGERVDLDESEVIQIRTPHPTDIHRGLSPVRSLMADLDATALSSEWIKSFFANSAQPGGVIEYPERLDDAEYKQIAQRWNEQHQGTANAGRVAILEGAKWSDAKITQRDMQWVEARRLNGDIIREAYGFPKFAQGIVEDVNRATADASDAFFARYLTVSRLDRIKDALNVHLLPMFGIATTRGLVFDYVNPVPTDREADNAELTAKTGAFVQMHGTGLFDPASLLEALNLPSIELSGTGAVDPVTGLPVGTDGASAGDPRALAEILQKLYLSVNVVITPKEARALMVDAGMDLDLSVDPTPEPPPAPASPPGPGGGAPSDPPGASFGAWLAWQGEARADSRGSVRGAREPGPEARRVQRDWSRALDDLLAVWRSVVAGWRASALEQAREALAQEQPGLLASISVPTIGAAVELSAAMVDLAGLSARRVVQEAGAAGVQTAEGVADADLMGRTAAATVQLLANRYQADFATEVLRWYGSGRSVAEVLQHAEAWADNLAEGGVGAHARSQLGGALTRAQNDGRLATFRVSPQAKYYASEILDGNTCKPCSNIDGQELPNLDAVILAYGGGGGYLFCEGRERCRGMVVAGWEQV